jgi:hypothetical protein
MVMLAAGERVSGVSKLLLGRVYKSVASTDVFDGEYACCREMMGGAKPKRRLPSEVFRGSNRTTGGRS